MVDCEQRNYWDSVDFCASQGMTIASIHNQEDNDLIWGMLQDQGCYAYIGAESYGTGEWSWNDGTPWDYVSPLNDGINGVGEHHIAFQTNGEWHDWGTGDSLHGVVRAGGKKHVFIAVVHYYCVCMC